jgi:tetratricopeptide (TPR) repeat protein
MQTVWPVPQALIAFERTTELNPNNAPAHAWRAAALTGLGRPDESLTAIDQAIRLSPSDPQLWLWHLFRKQRERLYEGLRRAGMPE